MHVSAKGLYRWQRYGGKNQLSRSHADASLAKYERLINENPTLEDRIHWVSRGEFLLADRRTGRVMASYTGFVANTVPAYGGGNSA